MSSVCPSYSDWQECPNLVVHCFIGDEAQVDEKDKKEEEDKEEEEDEKENGDEEEDGDRTRKRTLVHWPIYHLVVQWPWQAYSDFINDNEVLQGQSLGIKTWRQYEDREDEMEQFLDNILYCASHSQQDNSQSTDISNPVTWL